MGQLGGKMVRILMIKNKTEQSWKEARVGDGREWWLFIFYVGIKLKLGKVFLMTMSGIAAPVYIYSIACVSSATPCIQRDI